MVKYSIIGSGSSANAYIIEHEASALLIDNGFSVRELISRATAVGHQLNKLTAILLTHTHADHIRGVGAAGRKFGIPVSVCRGTDLRSFVRNGRPDVMIVEPGISYQTGAFRFLPFETRHDAPSSISYSISCEVPDGSRLNFVIITDTGEVTPEMMTLAADADVLFLEANYDEPMLLAGPYPRILKRRIQSKYGHLSNRAAGELLAVLAAQGRDHLTGKGDIRRIHLCHLSETNNTPELVSEACRPAYDAGLLVEVCRKGQCCPHVI